jgi:hypothetical protein
LFFRYHKTSCRRWRRCSSTTTKHHAAAGVVVLPLPHNIMPPLASLFFHYHKTSCRRWRRCSSATTKHHAAAGVVVLPLPQNIMPFPEDDGVLVSPGHSASIELTVVYRPTMFINRPTIEID